MRHDPINATSGSAPPRGKSDRRPRRAATRPPTPLDLGIPVAATEDQGELLAAEVMDPERTEPIVCLSTRAGEDRPAFDHHRVRKEVGRDAIIRAVRTGPASRFLSALLPTQLGVFGGAARIWWPGVDDDSDPRDHPLVLDRMGRYGPRALEVLGERFNEGPPTGPSKRPPIAPKHGGKLVALPGGAERERRAESQHWTPPASPDRDQQLLLGALDTARDEIRTLREKLAELRLDAMTPGDRNAAIARRRATEVPEQATPPSVRVDQLAQLAIPEAVHRDRVRAHHLEIVAAWLARDHDAGRRDRPLGPFAIGADYLESVDRNRGRVSPEALAAVAARIASGKQGEADDLDVGAWTTDAGDQELRAEDGSPCWSCAVPGVDGGLRLRWWTREDGAVELRDLV
ncbi:hypothetical protein [Patulibacter minatonensis]|uniref:hypothetical protein n=1 Tax=Patulibacter minatonensis TaxID=298163 RepID=UPI00047BAE92|nr:hypothetical protein [Patulibacter minatonensis]